MDLAEVYMRLVDRGLVERDSNLVIRWGSKSNSGMIGHSSVLMKTIIVNPKLDTENISENALNYAVYTQICRVSLGFGHDRATTPAGTIRCCQRTQTECWRKQSSVGSE